MPLLREDQRQPLQAMLDKALVQTQRPASSPSTVAEVKASNTAATEAKAGDAAATDAKVSELNPAQPAARRTWGWLALIAAALALFVGGLIRSRFDSARPTLLREAA
jgi:hypothetical protein